MGEGPVAGEGRIGRQNEDPLECKLQTWGPQRIGSANPPLRGRLHCQRKCIRQQTADGGPGCGGLADYAVLSVALAR